MNTLRLPVADGSVQAYTLLGRPQPQAGGARPFNRVVYSAVHVVADVLGTTDPWEQPCIDWETTLAYRRYLWDLGLGVAEAMDTAQRGMGLGWPEARRLIAHTLAAAKDHPRGAVVCGVATDQLDPAVQHPLAAIADAYVEQLDEVQSRGGRAVLMASRALAASAKGPDDYLAVYDRVLAQAREPVVLHWLGEAFDAQLRSYWGCARIDRAMDTVIELMETHADRIDGIKLSLLDAGREKEMRRRLPAGTRMYTGDDFNYPELIEGDGEHHSHALLGIFDAIAPLASAALGRLAEGDAVGFRGLLDPTVPLARHIFRAPTQYYKAGVVFLAWLNGHQNHFQMVGGLESSRSTVHFAELFRLADAAGALRDPELALARMRLHLAHAGVPA